MKQTHFKEAVSPSQRKALHRWFWYSCLFIIVCITVLASIYAHQYYYLQSLLQESQRLEPSSTKLQTILAQKRKLKEEESILKNYTAKMARTRTKCAYPAQLLHILLNFNDHNISLQNLDFKKKFVTLTLDAQNTQQIIDYIQLLSKQPLFVSIEITKIEPTAQQVKAYIEAKLH